MRTLRFAAAAEAVSLTILLLNLLTTHTEAVASLVGPLHGTAYLVTVVAVWQIPDTRGTGARWRAAVPGIGGLLAVRRLRHDRSAPPAGPAVRTADPS
ncbi:MULTISPECIES: DUF3817 domain-containing protein [Streptomyces]|uniref:DUF3817 domain-containing protein n=1 Tax=Streptomyces lycii TaxID=2654337 RepID=A0ABQ7FG91_9ACTN|nr:MULTISPECIES: DUF3817 domain-containing protein [Streptomyces]KAF4406669.1 DUF3817 domain-containing protein [Streptomyces lycii]PGH48786.1 hypothetical protein CRI70_21295 [Streptomyces sp. Ru87]